MEHNVVYIGNDRCRLYVGSSRRCVVTESAAPPLPYDAEIEYLQSNGYQYIDTGLTSSQNLFEYDFIVSASNTSGNLRVVIGADRGFNVGVQSGTYRSTSACVSNVQASVNTPVHILFSTNPSLGAITLIIDNVTFSGTYSNYTYNNKVGLFAAGNGDYKCSSRIYRASIKINSVLVMDLIPVRVGQVGYMYDRVSGELFGNAGTGDFILGNDKT